jgi:stage II sporulation protein D
MQVQQVGRTDQQGHVGHVGHVRAKPDSDRLVRWSAVAFVAGLLAAFAGCETVKGLRTDITKAADGVKGDSTPSSVATIGPAASSITSEPDIRVRITAGVREKVIGGPATVVVRLSGTGTGVKPAAPVTLATPIKITSGPAGLRVADAGGDITTFDAGSQIEVLSSDGRAEVQAAGGTPLRMENASYPGFVQIKPRWNEDATQMDIIVVMPIESYLPGVLSHELFPNWPRQTNEAQAVAARTYAIHERNRARTENRPWDVEDTESDQVFGGVTRNPIPNEAVRNTRGQVLTSQGRLIRAYYSSQCGGRPGSASAVWPTRKGWEFNLAEPLQGKSRDHACQQSTLYRWQITRTDDDVNKRLRAWGQRTKHEAATLTRLRLVAVEKRNDADRPNSYTLTDDNSRTYSIRAEELREALNERVSGLPAITRENRVNSGDLELEVWADQARIRGRGWGHGVGMCQWCAKGFADQGKDWNTMLRLFYPGAEVVKAY